MPKKRELNGIDPGISLAYTGLLERDNDSSCLVDSSIPYASKIIEPEIFSTSFHRHPVQLRSLFGRSGTGRPVYN